MQNYELKRLALNAKNRLIGNKKGNGASLKSKASPISANIKIKTISLSDENFDHKVREVLEHDTLAPIREIMDEAYYKSLSASMKEKYLLEVIEKFLICKKKFDSEVSHKSVL